VIVVVLVYQLEVLHAGLVHSPIKIQYESLHLYRKSKNSDCAILTLIPLGRLVEEEHDIFDVAYLKLLLDRMLSLKK